MHIFRRPPSTAWTFLKTSALAIIGPPMMPYVYIECLLSIECVLYTHMAIIGPPMMPHVHIHIMYIYTYYIKLYTLHIYIILCYIHYTCTLNTVYTHLVKVFMSLDDTTLVENTFYREHLTHTLSKFSCPLTIPHLYKLYPRSPPALNLASRPT